MKIWTCANNKEVRKRWNSFLAEKYELRQLISTQDLDHRLRVRDGGLLLVHAQMFAPSESTEVRTLISGNKVFLFSDRPDDDQGLAFFKMGVVGYANTYIAPARLLEAVGVVLSGSVWVGQKVMQRLIRETMASRAPEIEKDNETPHNTLLSLTERELQTAGLIAQGLSNLEIAYELEISERTVKAHLSSIYAKTGTGSRLNLALLVNQSGTN